MHIVACMEQASPQPRNLCMSNLAVASATTSSIKPIDDIESRRTSELVVAVCGPLGSGTTQVSTLFIDQFKLYDYTVKFVKISDLIVRAYEQATKDSRLPRKIDLTGKCSKSDRIARLQSAGNILRENFGTDFLAQLVIREIAVDRDLNRDSRKVAWVLDSLKHPDEVKLLRTVYDKMFNLVGVLCPRNERRKRLQAGKHLSSLEAETAIGRDESEDFAFGQKLLKTLQYADFFVRNYRSNIEHTVKRYTDLVVGDNTITPTKEEFAMFVAYASSYRSGCLSRQVGAAITSENGDIISVGYNDPPKGSGGLYSTEDTEKNYDFRCMAYGEKRCNNESFKKEMRGDIARILGDNSVNTGIAQDIASLISKNVRINDLTEFCRAVHAEMSAITTASRRGESIRDAILFVTTFPCHNCAKHIIASGIQKVFYIEPYEKSLALEMHGDAIVFEPTTEERDSHLVEFLHFEGVSPRQYGNRFPMTDDRKKDGKLEKKDLRSSAPIYAQFLDSFIDYESKVIKHLGTINFAVLEAEGRIQ